jgi:hypothetical protein
MSCKSTIAQSIISGVRTLDSAYPSMAGRLKRQ